MMCDVIPHCRENKDAVVDILAEKGNLIPTEKPVTEYEVIAR